MEKIEYYTLRPNLKQIYGKKVDEKTEFTEQTEDGCVHQTFKDLTLTTKIHRNSKVGDYEIDETSEIKVKIPSGTILIWSESEGFIVPQFQMCTLEEVEEDIKNLKDIYRGDKDDTKRDETKDV